MLQLSVADCDLSGPGFMMDPPILHWRKTQQGNAESISIRYSLSCARLFRTSVLSTVGYFIYRDYNYLIQIFLKFKLT